METHELLQHLGDLERALHEPEVRCHADRLTELLHESFAEFGRSGRAYDLADILKALQEEVPSWTVWSQDFLLARVADEVALLTYKSARVDEQGQLSAHTVRSSLWQRTSQGWRLRFHQGTPTEPFLPNATGN